MGVSAQATVKVIDTKLEASGPLLITHWGLSGPGILRLSAWGALLLAAKNYQFKLAVNWLPAHDYDTALALLKDVKNEHAKKVVAKKSVFEFPNRLWERMVITAGISAETKWADLKKIELQTLASTLTQAIFHVQGKSTFKDEFVTAGGIDLKEVNFKTMESKLLPNLYFVGEILNIDAITGGFNFQNAWTNGFIASEAIAKLDFFEN
jgi:predicted Rossmann fold flavoprotein